jgi:TonB-linked SusC/RagA family outer membrane protein
MKTLGPVDYFKLQADNATTNGVGNYDMYRFYGLGLSYIRDTAEAINFQDKLFKPAGMQDYTLSINGGSKMTKYALSGNYLNQEGVLINTSYKRYLGRIVLDHQLSEKLKLGINTTYSYTVGAGSSPSSIANGSASGSLMYSIWGYRPFAGSGNPATNLNAQELTDYPIDPLITGQNNYMFNPLISQQHLVRNNKDNNLSANGFIEYTIIPELKLRISGGIDYTTSENVSFNDSLTLYGSKLSAVGINGPNGRITNGIVSSWVNENTLNYVRTFRKAHNVNIMAGLSEQGYKNRSVSVDNTALLYPGLGIYGLSQSSAPGLVGLSQSSGLWTAQSFFGRLQYNYLSKYYFTASLRADGSSKFAAENRWSRFPAFGVSWRIIEEPFMKKAKAIMSEAKVRLTYGKSGNNRIPIFSYLSQVASGYTGLFHNSTFNTYNNSPAYTFNNVIAPASILSTLGNASLKWETTSSINLGVDLGFFNNRINVVIDAYRKKTNDLLYNAPVPTSLGFRTAFKNIGNIENKGLEISINTINIKNKTFTWSSSFNISFNRNKVLSLAEGLESAPIFVQWDNAYNTVAPYLLKVGQPLGVLYGLVWQGNYQYSDFDLNSSGKYILKDNVPSNQSSRPGVAGGSPQPGDIKFKDLNGDGVITNADLTIIGHGFPIHTGGFGNNFSYKGFDLNLFFQWSYGNQIQNANRIWFESNGVGKNQFESVKNRWTPDNQNNILFRAGGGSPAGPNLYSTRTLEDGSFLRFKTFSLGYNLPDKLLRKYKIKGARLFISGQNLYTWTKYSGSDPEVTVTYGQPYALAPGFDYSAYPRARTFSIGTNITF